ncbi:hypothetical protein HNP84_004232 [Thermocatellispora tengchongensis]|uniref:DUF4386 domain-containing protein n=1 Tax=Thermocatellispora tengchongensis TaxID=1073253 RepID=A0A840PAS2_9ACTN|nr:DUF4386 domain-containing protein [Thermocatellispora tengchongensis]MBB5134500.1 hypothetical protein [Thermocatellispora tengchongensis]
METNHRAARFIGALFLLALLSNGIGSELAESSTDRTVILVGELLELVCGAAVIGVGVATYAVFRDLSPGLSAGYLGVRITEAAVNAMIVVSTLTALNLGDAHRELLLEQRYQAQLVYIYVFTAGAVVWYALLHRLRLVPRFITIWGLAGVAILLAGSLFDLFGGDLDMLVYGLPLGLNEFFLGGWLIARGFRTPVTADARV